MRGSVASINTDSRETLSHFKKLLSANVDHSKLEPGSPHPLLSSSAATCLTSQLSHAPLPLRPPVGSPFYYEDREIVECLDDPFDPGDVRLALSKMRNLACGEDKVSVAGLSGLDVDQIAAFFHELSTLNALPISWTQSILVPIPKVPNPLTSQLRGLSIQTCIRRLYSCCLLPRLVKWMDSERVIPQGQSGFRRGYRTTDNLVILRAIHERCVYKGKELFVALLDTHKAFDEVLRDRLFLLLHDMGAHGAFLDMLQQFYTDTKTVLRLRGRYSSPFDVDKGVLQGDSLLPLLFIIYISELNTSDPDDPSLNDVSISELLLADNIALPSCSPEGFQRKLLSASVQLARIGLKLNPSKSVWLRLVKVTSRVCDFCVRPDGGSPITEVSSAKYIGFDLISGSQWNISPYVDRCILKARSVSASLMQ